MESRSRGRPTQKTVRDKDTFTASSYSSTLVTVRQQLLGKVKAWLRLAFHDKTPISVQNNGKSFFQNRRVTIRSGTKRLLISSGEPSKATLQRLQLYCDRWNIFTALRLAGRLGLVARCIVGCGLLREVWTRQLSGAIPESKATTTSIFGDAAWRSDGYLIKYSCNRVSLAR